MKRHIPKLRRLSFLAIALALSSLTGCVYYGEDDGYYSGPTYSRGYDEPILMPNVLIVEGGIRHDYAYYRRYPHIYQRDRLRYSGRFSRGNSHHYRPSRPAHGSHYGRPSHSGSYSRPSRPSHGGGYARPERPSHGGSYSRPERPSHGGGYARPERPSHGGGNSGSSSGSRMSYYQGLNGTAAGKAKNSGDKRGSGSEKEKRHHRNR